MKLYKATFNYRYSSSIEEIDQKDSFKINKNDHTINVFNTEIDAYYWLLSMADSYINSKIEQLNIANGVRDNIVETLGSIYELD